MNNQDTSNCVLLLTSATHTFKKKNGYLHTIADGFGKDLSKVVEIEEVTFVG